MKDYWKQSVTAVASKIDAIDINNVKEPAKILTGIKAFDDLQDGLAKGSVFVLAGRPSMGTSSLAMNIARNVALGDTPKPVGVISLDWSKEEYLQRMLCSMTGYSHFKLAKGYIKEEMKESFRKAAQQLEEAPIVIDDACSQTLSSLLDTVKRMKEESKTELLIIDKAPLIQLGSLPLQASDGKSREYGKEILARSLKQAALQLEVALVVLADISRDVETRSETPGIPCADDVLYCCPSLYVDSVGTLYRPCKYPDLPDSEDKSLTILKVEHTSGGKVREVRLNLDDEFLEC